VRKLTIFVLVLLGTFAIVAWRSAPATAGNAKGLLTAGNSSVYGSYAFSETIQDEEGGANGPGGSPGTGQIGVAVGALTFDGNGHLTGVISQNTRGCNVACGYLQVSRVPIVGTYTVNSDGSATFDTCFHITGANTNPPGLPPQNVHVIWEAAFSLFFTHFRYIQTRIGDCAVTDPNLLGPIPNVTIGTADKV